MTGFLSVSTTTGNRETADRVATELVSRRLAACVQVLGPMHSTYHWQGRVESAEEWLCVAKCRADRFEEVETLVARVHPYDTPELIGTPITGVSKAYGAWLEAELPPGDAG